MVSVSQFRELRDLMEKYSFSPDTNRYICSIVDSGLKLAEQRGIRRNEAFPTLVWLMREIYDQNEKSDRRKKPETLLAVVQDLILSRVEPSYERNYKIRR